MNAPGRQKIPGPKIAGGKEVKKEKKTHLEEWELYRKDFSSEY